VLLGHLRRSVVVEGPEDQVVEDLEALVAQALDRRLARHSGQAQVEEVHSGQVQAHRADQADRREVRAWQCLAHLVSKDRSDAGCRHLRGRRVPPTRSLTASGCGALKAGAA